MHKDLMLGDQPVAPFFLECSHFARENSTGEVDGSAVSMAPFIRLLGPFIFPHPLEKIAGLVHGTHNRSLNNRCDRCDRCDGAYFLKHVGSQESAGNALHGFVLHACNAHWSVICLESSSYKYLLSLVTELTGNGCEAWLLTQSAACPGNPPFKNNLMAPATSLSASTIFPASSS